jgi:hypothetical protein
MCTKCGQVAIHTRENNFLLNVGGEWAERAARRLRREFDKAHEGCAQTEAGTALFKRHEPEFREALRRRKRLDKARERRQRQRAERAADDPRPQPRAIPALESVDPPNA